MEPTDTTGGAPAIYVFGEFRFDARERSLTGPRGAVRLTPKAADLLSALLRAHGRVATKDALIQQVWPDTFVADTNLTFQINRLRQALGDNVTSPVYIETIPARGYRFICPVIVECEVPLVSPQTDVAPASREPVSVAPAARSSFASSLMAAGLIAAVLTGVLSLAALTESSSPHVARVLQLTDDGKLKGRLFPIGESRLLFRDGLLEHFILRVDDRTLARYAGLDGYEVLDVSPVRHEALVQRPLDRGAEHALWAVRLDGSQRRRIGMVLPDHEAVWSHDGQYIAYDAQGAIFLVDSSGDVERRLAGFTGSVGSIQWAPGDHFLRVVVFEMADRTVTNGHYDIDVKTGRARRVPELSLGDVCCGTWMPNSGDYLFVRMTPSGRELWLLPALRLSLWRRPRAPVQIETVGTLPLLIHAAVPAVGAQTAYVTGAGEARLTVYDPARRSFVPMLNGLSAFAVSPSPDRRSIVYITVPDNRLWRAAADGTRARPLTDGNWFVDAVAWRPDGRGLAIRARAPALGHTKIYLLNSEGGRPEPIDAGDLEQGSPSWSEDGTRIVFGDVPETYGKASGTECLHIYDLEARTLSDVPRSAGLWSGRWSPRGRYIAATTIGDRSLKLYDVKTGAWRDLGLPHVGELTWSLDGEAIFAEPERPARWLVKVRVPDGRPERVVDLGDQLFHFGGGIAPDGRPLIARAADEVYALQLQRR